MVLAGAITASAGTAASAEEEIGVAVEPSAKVSELGIYLNETLPQALSEENADILDIIREYASQTIPYYLPSVELYGEYDVSEPIKIHNWDGGEDTEKYMFVVSKNNVMVGSLTAEYVKDRIISVFYEESLPEINAALASGTEIQLGYSNDCFLIYSQGVMNVVENPYFVDESFASGLTVDPASSEMVNMDQTTTAAPQSRSGSWSISGVQNVDNQSHPDLPGHSLCWAACIASMGMQKNRNATYTAKSIYESCRDSENQYRPSDQYPKGEPEWIRFGLTYVVDILASQTSALPAAGVKGLLQANKPIYVSLRKRTADGGHGMVLFSYTEIDTNNGQYIFMDPSKGSGRTSVMIDASVMKDGTNLKVTIRGGGTYDYWKYSFY